MGFSEEDRRILAEAKVLFKNPKLRHKDIQEWTVDEETAKENCQDGEVVAELPGLRIWVCVFKVDDKR